MPVHSNFQCALEDEIERVKDIFKVDIIYVDKQDLDDNILISGFVANVDEAVQELKRQIDELKKDESIKTMEMDPKFYDLFMGENDSAIKAIKNAYDNIIIDVTDGRSIFIRGKKREVKACSDKIKERLSFIKAAADLNVENGQTSFDMQQSRMQRRNSSPDIELPATR